MKILIIGSEGFIGNHLKANFLNAHDVTGADVLQKKGITKYLQLSPLNTDFNVLFEREQFDVCINASGNGSVPISINKPIYDFELNVTNTIKILDAIRTHNPECKFINLSSAAVYGNPSSLPIKETSSLKPLSPYGWHKLYSEQICKEYYYLYNIQTINLRLFSVYGENLRKQLFWDLYHKCLHAEEVELFGTGNETRDFIYIEDLLRAVECVINSGLFNGESINIASGQETTIRQVATIFVKEVNPSININFNMLVKPGDPLNWRADVGLLKSFGFESQISIEEGLKNVVKWLKESK